MSFYIGCGMVLTQGDKFILVQETRGTGKLGLFSLPGGTLEIREDLLECVVREVQEETGATVQPEAFLGVEQMVLANGSNVLFFVFLGKVEAGFAFVSEEHDVIRAFTYNEVAALEAAASLRAPTVLRAIEIARAGKHYPLSVVHAYHLESLASITVSNK